jgi:predicted transcriptional regulator
LQRQQQHYGHKIQQLQSLTEGCLALLHWRNHMSTLIQANITDQLERQAQQMVDHGLATSMEFVVTESLRRYLESHQEALVQQFVQEDVRWGLGGND